MDTLIAINPDPELAALLSAYETLDKKRAELCSGPLAFFKIVTHARDHVDRLISERYAEGAPVLHDILDEAEEDDSPKLSPTAKNSDAAFLSFMEHRSGCYE